MSGRGLPGLPRALWRIRGTLMIQAVLVAVGIITKDMSAEEFRRLLERVGFDYALLAKGHFWHLLTGSWVQSTPGIELSMLALVFGGTVFLEILAGTQAMVATCITGDWVATVLTALTTRVLAGLGSSTAAAMLTIPDAGSSAMAHAGYGAVVMLMPRKWLKVGVPILIFLTAIQFFLIDFAPAIAHAWATAYGMLIGWFVLRPRIERESTAAEHEEENRSVPSSIAAS